MTTKFDYDVCLSFAGEDRYYVQEVANELKKLGIRTFYDLYEEVNLWGKDLYEHLDDIYKNSAKYCIIFVSENYAKKLWTNHERKSAQERAFRENSEYILPAKFDNTKIPGLRETVGYINIANKTPVEFAKLIAQKVSREQNEEYLPPVLDLFYKTIEMEPEEQDKFDLVVYRFFQAAKRLTKEERTLFFNIVTHACPAELPENLHINIDLLSRILGFTPSKIIRILSSINSLGFTSVIKEDKETEGRIGKEELIYIQWNDLSLNGYGNATGIIAAIADTISKKMCHGCTLNALINLDFSQLSDSTAKNCC